MGSIQYALGLFLCAFAMGTVFDLYNTVTGSTKWLKWLRPVLDISFWILAAGLVYYVAFLTNQGRLRIYTLVLLLLGYGCYRLLLHRAVVGSAEGLVRLVRGVAKLIVTILRLLIWRPVALILTTVWLLIRGIYRLLLVVENGVVKIVWVAWLVISFPGRRIWPTEARWQIKLVKHWEDFWIWLSNRIANRSERV